jgi:hypothetical protein
MRLRMESGNVERHDIGMEVESRNEGEDCSIVKREKRRKHVLRISEFGDNRVEGGDVSAL